MAKDTAARTFKDILGKEHCYSCLGCAIGSGEMELPGGVIYDGKGIILAADPEIPIPGFLIITSKRHIQSFSELTAEEITEVGTTIARAEKALKELGIAKEITLVQEERSKHFHIWIFAHHEWMKEKFGTGISYLRDISAYARQNASEKDIEEVLDAVQKIKAYFIEK